MYHRNTTPLNLFRNGTGTKPAMILKWHVTNLTCYYFDPIQNDALQNNPTRIGEKTRISMSQKWHTPNERDT